MKDVSMSKTEMEIQQAIEAVHSEEKLVYQDLDIIKSLILGEEGETLVQETIELFAGWTPIRVEVEQMEFLSLAAPILATGLYTALQGMQIKDLLEASQAANEALSVQAKELQAQSEELWQTSEELQEQNVELTVQREQVEEANRLKSEFLSNMSHELRTPLNSVMALSRVLISQAKDKLSEEELNYLNVIARNGKNLLTLINDILHRHRYIGKGSAAYL